MFQKIQVSQVREQLQQEMQAMKRWDAPMCKTTKKGTNGNGTCLQLANTCTSTSLVFPGPICSRFHWTFWRAGAWVVTSATCSSSTALCWWSWLFLSTSCIGENSCLSVTIHGLMDHSWNRGDWELKATQLLLRETAGCIGTTGKFERHGIALSLPSLDFFKDVVCLPARPVHSSLLGLSVTQFVQIHFVCSLRLGRLIDWLAASDSRPKHWWLFRRCPLTSLEQQFAPSN